MVGKISGDSLEFHSSSPFTRFYSLHVIGHFVPVLSFRVLSCYPGLQHNFIQSH